MRVAVLTQYFPTSSLPWAGHSAYQTLRILASMCDLHVFYPEATYPAPLLKAMGRTGKPMDRSWSPPDVAVTYIPYPVLPVVSRPLNGFTIASKLRQSIRRYTPDILLNYVAYPDGYAAIRIGHDLRVPVVLTAIGSDLNRMSDPLCAALTRSALRQANGVITVSRDLAKTAIANGANPATTQAILNGCDTSVFHPGDRARARQELALGAEEQVVVYVGRLDVRKGLIELIDALAALRPTHPRLRAYIVGDGPDRPLLVEAIAKHGMGEAITLVPSCPTQRVALWMAASDLVTLPSYKEGCPNVVVEALAAGRPVVATHVGGIPELMDESCGRLVPPQDVPAQAQALEQVLAESWNAEDISSRQSRSWSQVAEELYASLGRIWHAAKAGRPSSSR